MEELIFGLSLPPRNPFRSEPFVVDRVNYLDLVTLANVPLAHDPSTLTVRDWETADCSSGWMYDHIKLKTRCQVVNYWCKTGVITYSRCAVLLKTI